MPHKSKLRPCPHCGSDNLGKAIERRSGSINVVCHECNSNAPEYVWNIRHSDADTVRGIRGLPESAVADLQ